MIEGGKTYLIVKSLITGSVRGQTIKYIADNVLGKGTCYLPEAQRIFCQQQEFTEDFISDLKQGLGII